MTSEDPSADCISSVYTIKSRLRIASGLIQGRLFRRIRRRGPPSAPEDYAAEGLSPQAVWRIVKRRAALAGLPGDYGAHSLRAGFVTEAGRQNLSLGDTMALTSHRDVKSVIRYNRAGGIGETAWVSGAQPIGLVPAASESATSRAYC
jgi:hypothetical protein